MDFDGLLDNNLSLSSNLANHSSCGLFFKLSDPVKSKNDRLSSHVL
jgi:hypothetical protein